MIRAALVALVLAPLAAWADRPPLQTDFDRCANAAVGAGAGADLQGQLTLSLLVRRDGKVYAAYVAGEKGIQSRKLERCLSSQALIWVLPEAAVDYHRGYGPISFAPPGSSAGGNSTRVGAAQSQTAASVFLPELANPPPYEPPNLEVARQTLEVADFATPAQHGLADLDVKNYDLAIKSFRGALSQNANDTEALRGLVQALAESGGDLKEARQLAERLEQAAPGSVVGHEAMIRTCLAARDEKCAFEHWKPANAAKDFGPRSRLFKDELQGPVQQAAADLRAAQPKASASDKPAEGAAGVASGDPCAEVQGDEQQVLCVVKRCLDAGSVSYAQELSKQNNIDYEAGAWRVKPVGQGKMLVTREIATKTTPPQQHNAMWLVKYGDQLVMQPTNVEARQITLTHNACASRVSSGK